MVFQSKDGVTSEIHGWFGRSFESAAIRAAIGSAGSGAAMAGCKEECFEATEGNNPSEECNVAWFHNHWVDFNEILIQYSWGIGDVLGTE